MAAHRRDVLLDVTRLIWRRWRGGLPTGVDRVCLAYLHHFGYRAKAVVQRKGVQVTLSQSLSRELFQLLETGGPGFRGRLVLIGLKALFSFSAELPAPNSLYLNVGHTGLDEPSLPAWIARHQLTAVYLVHDLIPITHPQFCRAGEGGRHERRMRTALVSATGIISNSQATARELANLAQRLGLAVPPIVVAWLSGSSLHSKVRPSTSVRPYFVVLGTIEGRKNHRLLLDVWRRLVERLSDAAPKLVIVGKRGWEAEDVFRQMDTLGSLKGHVEERPHCSDSELTQLVAGACALLMPSFAEGYGLPVFEALEIGTPVIATDLPVYREVAGSIPEYLSPVDVLSWEGAVIEYMRDGPARAAQLKRMAGFRAPDWNEHFEKVEHWLDTLID